MVINQCTLISINFCVSNNLLSLTCLPSYLSFDKVLVVLVTCVVSHQLEGTMSGIEQSVSLHFDNYLIQSK